MAIIEQFVYDVLILSELGRYPGNHPRFSDPITFDQTIKHNFKIKKVAHFLAFRDPVTYHAPHGARTSSDKLVFTDNVARTHFEQFYSTLTFTQTVTFEYANRKKLFNTVFFNDKVIFRVLKKVRSFSDSLQLRQTFSAQVINTVQGSPPYKDPATSDSGSHVGCGPALLTFVQFVGDDTLTLPCPDYGDIHEQDYSRIVLRNKYNQVYVYRPDYWPTTNTYHLKFPTLTDKLKDDLELFYLKNLGKVIHYIDYRNVNRMGIITTSELEFVEKNDCTWEVSFEFAVFGNGING